MSFYDALFGGALADGTSPSPVTNAEPAPSALPPPTHASVPVGAVAATVATSNKKPVIPAAWNRSLVPPAPHPIRKPSSKPAPAQVSTQTNPPAQSAASKPVVGPTSASAPTSTSNNTNKTGLNPSASYTSGTSKKRAGTAASSDPFAIWDTAYDPNFPTDYAAYREWRDHLRKRRPPPPPLPTGPVAPLHGPSHESDPDAMDVDRAPPTADEPDVSSSESSESDSSHDNESADEDNLDGEPIAKLDLKQFPAFLRMYLDESMDVAALAQRLAVMVPSKHLAPDQPPPIKKSRVVVLENMIDAADVDDELEGETTEECSKFGKVVKCFVRVLNDLPEPNVRIFVYFAKYDGAKAAVAAMHGRFFGGREVRAALYDELWFDLAKYDAVVSTATESLSGPGGRRDGHVQISRG